MIALYWSKKMKFCILIINNTSKMKGKEVKSIKGIGMTIKEIIISGELLVIMNSEIGVIEIIVLIIIEMTNFITKE